MRTLIVIALHLLAVTGVSAADVVIADKGQAKAEIVIPAQPNPYVRFAAEELKQYLDKMTGGNFQIVSQPTGAVAIRLGQSPEAEAAGLNPETLKRDGFFICVKSHDIFILGVDNPAVDRIDLFRLFYDETRRGTLLGVYDFLEQLGVRWPAPGPDHEFVPLKATVSIPEGVRKVEPFFQDRQLRGYWDFSQLFPDANAYCPNAGDIFLWGLRMKLSGRGMLVGCHSENSLQLNELWGAESEHAALINGKRNSTYSCWTDPAVAAIWEKAADTYFSGKPPADAGLPHLKPYLRSSWPWPFIVEDEFMIDPMDHSYGSDGRCRCQRCNEFRAEFPCEDDTEILWKIVAGVAESIKIKHPGKFITTLVYPPKRRFPKYVKIPDNVRVRICIFGPITVLTPDRLKADLEAIRTWKTALGGNKPPLWTYQIEGKELTGVPVTYPHLMAEFLKATRNDIAGLYYEVEALTHTHRNLDSYIAARLLWDPDRDVEAELADYFKSYYGPAAEPAQRLFKRLEDNWITCYQAIEAMEGSPDPWLVAPTDTPDMARQIARDKRLRRQHFVWSKVYTPEEVANIDAMITAVEKAAAADPACAKRASLLRPWLFDIMKSERARMMNKEEVREKLVARASVIAAQPETADWVAAHIYKLVSAAPRAKPQLAARGQFRLLRSGDTLWLRAELSEPNISDSLTKSDRPAGDPDIYRDNHVEIFLYACDTKDIWQIIINDQGNWASQWLNTGTSQWTPLEEFQVTVQRTLVGWSLDAAIPLDKLGAGELRFNLTRSRQIKGNPNDLSTWSPLATVGGEWYNPDNYGTLVFEGK